MLSIHLYFACKALVFALQEISLEIRLAVTGINKAHFFVSWLPTIQSYSRLILNLSPLFLCGAYLTALGWDAGLLRAAQKEPSTNERSSKCKKDYGYL